ncbi:DUF1330 domain-containing protein [Cellulosimicrobium sp. ES-005]|uniref:DUF1330 domain-containing protein n=1 Tax=Cellulosimicrobium sp. ES-005 TaxID=3163031 RepID=A0AAU8G101_9MICO
MPKGYWVSVYRAISDRERLTRYNGLAGLAVRAGGGRVLSNFGRVVAHEAGIAERVVLIEFDSFGQATRGLRERDVPGRAGGPPSRLPARLPYRRRHRLTG